MTTEQQKLAIGVLSDLGAVSINLANWLGEQWEGELEQALETILIAAAGVLRLNGFNSDEGERIRLYDLIAEYLGEDLIEPRQLGDASASEATT